MSGLGALKKLQALLKGTSDKLAQGEILSDRERRNYLAYLDEESLGLRAPDARPGYRDRRVPDLTSDDVLVRGSGMAVPELRAPVFNFVNDMLPALGYSQVLGPTSHGTLDLYKALNPNPARHRDMLKALLEDPSLIRHAQPEVQDALELDYIRDISGVQDYLYSPTLRNELQQRGFNSVLHLEDSFTGADLQNGLVALDPAMLERISRRYVGTPEFADDYAAQGITTRMLSKDLLQLGQPERPGKPWEKWKTGGLAQMRKA